MKNVKINQVSENQITQDMFENKKSYNLFIKAFRWMTELQELKNEGYILLEKGEIIEDDFIFSTDEDGKMPKVGTGCDSTMIMWVGATIGNKENTVYVYANELDPFKHISTIEPQYAKKWRPSA